MADSYLGYNFTVEPRELGSEILVAELGEKPFDSFVESEFGITAYIKKKDWHEEILEDLYILNSPEFTISYTIEQIPQVNWNEEWEKHFEPIDVDGRCHVRAPFHPGSGSEFEIVIEPKMSFGTGHHETPSISTIGATSIRLKMQRAIIAAGSQFMKGMPRCLRAGATR